MVHRIRSAYLWACAALRLWARRLVAHPLTTYALRTDASSHIIARVCSTEVRGEYLELRDIEGRLHVVRLSSVVSCLPARELSARSFQPIPVEGAL